MEEAEEAPPGGAYLKTFFANVIAGEHDYRGARLCVKLPQLCDALDTWNGSVSPEWAKDYFVRGDVPRGKIALTLTSVYWILQRAPNRWERQLIAANIGHSEWSVAAVLLGLNCIAPSVLEAIVNANWHCVPLADWGGTIKTVLVALRRCPIIYGCDASPYEVLQLRKILNCCIKVKGAANWEQERINMTEHLPVHFGIMENGRLSRSEWFSSTQRITEQLANEVVAQLVRNVHMVGIDEWWASRWAWAPSGSSTNKKLLKEAIAIDSRLDNSARAGKKTAFESLPDDYPSRILETEPIDIARGSTKSEPGGKQRALWASDDDCFIVSAYASLHIEKFMNAHGMLGKQAAADVAQWVLGSNISAFEHPCWLSLDYDDFNKGHEAVNLGMCDLAFAKAFMAHGHGASWVQERVKCALWVAKSHFNKYAIVGNSFWRAFSGLFSGSRDTARNNTMLHCVYAMYAEQQCKRLDPRFGVGQRYYSGDDEDVEMCDAASALLYYVVHKLNGHIMVPSKQMAGNVHEFLQRIGMAGKHTLRPLFSMLSTFACGNWNHEQHIWYDNIISSVSDNCMELHGRGMPLVYARRLAAVTIKACMRVPVHDSSGGTRWHKLEWWQYRNPSGTACHPLWYGIDDVNKAAPSLETRVIPSIAQKHYATDAWARKVHRLLPSLPQHRIDEYKRELCAMSYNKLYTAVKLETQQRAVVDMWPERVSTVPYHKFSYGELRMPDINELLLLLAQYPGVRRPATADEVASRMGLDQRAITFAGGWANVLCELPPHYTGMWEQPGESILADLRWHRCDPAITNWAVNTQAVAMMEQPRAHYTHVCTHIDETGIDERVVNLVTAANGAGKTTWVKECRHNGITVIDGDELLIKYDGVREQLRMLRKRMYGSDIAAMCNLFMYEYNTHSAQAACWQIDLSQLARQLVTMGYYVHIVVVDVPYSTIHTRCTARWWDSAKTARRHADWRATVDSIMRIQHDHISITTHSGFDQIVII